LNVGCLAVKCYFWPRFGYCWGSGYAQYLLEALPSGDLIPILTLDRAQQDQSWVGWMSRDFGAFSAGLGRFTAPLERYHFLGQWMARAYVISGLSLSPANFHSIIYESLLAGHAVTPLPMPNGYQDRLLKQSACTRAACAFSHV